MCRFTPALGPPAVAPFAVPGPRFWTRMADRYRGYTRQGPVDRSTAEPAPWPAAIWVSCMLSVVLPVGMPPQWNPGKNNLYLKYFRHLPKEKKPPAGPFMSWTPRKWHRFRDYLYRVNSLFSIVSGLTYSNNKYTIFRQTSLITQSKKARSQTERMFYIRRLFTGNTSFLHTLLADGDKLCKEF